MDGTNLAFDEAFFWTKEIAKDAVGNSPLFFLACKIFSSDATSGGICDKRGVASWAAGLEGLSFLKH